MNGEQQDSVRALMPLFLVLFCLCFAALLWCLLSSCVGRPILRSLSSLWEYIILSARTGGPRRGGYAEEEIWEMHSSLIFATLAISSSSSSLAAPTGDASQTHAVGVSNNHFIASRRGSVSIPRAEIDHPDNGEDRRGGQERADGAHLKNRGVVECMADMMKPLPIVGGLMSGLVPIVSPVSGPVNKIVGPLVAPLTGILHCNDPNPTEQDIASASIRFHSTDPPSAQLQEDSFNQYDSSAFSEASSGTQDSSSDFPSVPHSNPVYTSSTSNPSVPPNTPAVPPSTVTASSAFTTPSASLPRARGLAVEPQVPVNAAPGVVTSQLPLGSVPVKLPVPTPASDSGSSVKQAPPNPVVPVGKTAGSVAGKLPVGSDVPDKVGGTAGKVASPVGDAAGSVAGKLPVGSDVPDKVGGTAGEVVSPVGEAASPVADKLPVRSTVPDQVGGTAGEVVSPVGKTAGSVAGKLPVGSDVPDQVGGTAGEVVSPVGKTAGPVAGKLPVGSAIPDKVDGTAGEVVSPVQEKDVSSTATTTTVITVTSTETLSSTATA
ncbi:hypothetical protein K435DRAFT_960443 [Dendrothele bispora CBS 962.96]|uniref:Uncharacterized protein n=1 Tax=Dendrothele bispora (strain CBS 962.96) TaxID=1314807 RepID=A0A4S8MTV8_DENBC|nr:hypothetical protein K435DRAFT_960443 [Dendrothele bispora CBS 962.96]